MYNGTLPLTLQHGHVSTHSTVQPFKEQFSLFYNNMSVTQRRLDLGVFFTLCGLK